VKARIPWPNPLASALGFSLTSSNLVFHVVPSPPAFNLDVDLTASVASVAESFIHEELSPREAVAFWQTLHPTAPSPSDIEEQAIPGGLDPINATDDDCRKVDMDPEGVSIFATLLERLLARFEFDAQDLTVTLIHPGNMSLTLSLEEIRYHTVSKDTNHSPTRGENRTLSINGCHLAARNLDSKMPLTFTPGAPASTTSGSPSTSRPLSHVSSSSSIDEETQFAMSQSLAFLPHKVDPLSISTSSSMYQSVLSSTFLDPLDEISEAVPKENLVPPSSKALLNVSVSTTQKDNKLLSFGSLPIDIQLITPSPVANTSSDDPFLSHTEDGIHSDEILQVAVSMGVIACALRPWHIHGLLQLIQSLDGPHQKAPKVDAEPFDKSFTIFNIPLKIHTQLRGIVLLLLSPRSVNDSMTNSLENFFDRCLVPPPLDCGYTRIHLDGLTASLVCSSRQKQESDAPRSPTSNTAINSLLEFAMTDMSIFFFSEPPFDNKSSQMSAFPLLLTDPHLATQYSTSHIHPRGEGSYNHLPRFDIIDWTDEKCQGFGTRLSTWRVRLPKRGAYQYFNLFT
jgi:autophagy-related protein 2